MADETSRQDERWSGFGALADTGVREGIEAAHQQLAAELQHELDEQ